MNRRHFLKTSAVMTAAAHAAAHQAHAATPDLKNFINFASTDSPIEYDTDICIIGAGPAGISLALELANEGKRILLLHGGENTVTTASQAFYQGSNAEGSIPYPLGNSRLNALGGATGHWSGWCAQLSPMDFEKRDWVDHSGWPISYDDMMPFYQRAQSYFQLGNPAEYGSAFWAEQYPELPELNNEHLLTNIWQFSSPPINFGTYYQNALAESASLTVLQNAQVTELRTLENKTTVGTALVQTADGKRGTVKAKEFVLACGGIENARLLLASNQDNSAGLGNSADLVGRFFMEHLEVELGKVTGFDGQRMKDIKRKTLTNASEIGSVFCLSEAEQQANAVGNGAAFIAAPSFGSQKTGWTSLIEFKDAIAAGSVPSNLASGLWSMLKDLDTIVGVGAHLAQGKEMSTRISEKGAIDVISIAEQTPNPESRVTLSSQLDPLGNPLAELAWKIQDRDKTTVQKTVQLLAQEFQSSDTANIEVAEWLQSDTPADWPQTLRGGNHHMGTTRMSSSANTGVVDEHCRVHELDNLHIAGSSVFPTGGYATPTVTIVALAIKLADRLKTVA